MTSTTDNPMSEIGEEELALRLARPVGKEAQDVLAEMEWQRRLMKEQQNLNRAVMEEQHRLNKRLVIITAIATLVAAILGGLIQKYSPDITWPLKTKTQIETQRGKEASPVVSVPPTKFHETATINESSSSKPPKGVNK